MNYTIQMPFFEVNTNFIDYVDRHNFMLENFNLLYSSEENVFLAQGINKPRLQFLFISDEIANLVKSGHFFDCYFVKVKKLDMKHGYIAEVDLHEIKLEAALIEEDDHYIAEGFHAICDEKDDCNLQILKDKLTFSKAEGDNQVIVKSPKGQIVFRSESIFQLLNDKPELHGTLLKAKDISSRFHAVGIVFQIDKEKDTSAPTYDDSWCDATKHNPYIAATTLPALKINWCQDEQLYAPFDKYEIEDITEFLHKFVSYVYSLKQLPDPREVLTLSVSSTDGSDLHVQMVMLLMRDISILYSKIDVHPETELSTYFITRTIVSLVYGFDIDLRAGINMYADFASALIKPIHTADSQLSEQAPLGYSFYIEAILSQCDSQMYKRRYQRYMRVLGNILCAMAGMTNQASREFLDQIESK